MKKCPRCSKKYDGIECRFCGYEPTADPVRFRTLGDASGMKAPGFETPEVKTKKLSAAIIIAAVILVAGAVTAAMLNREKKPVEYDTTPFEAAPANTVFAVASSETMTAADTTAEIVETIESTEKNTTEKAESTTKSEEKLSLSAIIGNSRTFGTKNGSNCSGELTLEGSGDFTFKFSDRDFGTDFTIAENKGKVGNLKKINDYIYSVSVTDIEPDLREGESYTEYDEWTDDTLNYYYTDFGWLNAYSELMVIMPHSPTSALPSKFCDYLDMLNHTGYNEYLGERFYLFDVNNGISYVEIVTE